MKYNRIFHLPFSPGTTSDDRIASDISNLLYKPIVIQEKLDGSNSGICRYGVYARSHGDFSKNPWDIKMWELYEKIKKDIGEDVYLFMENMYGIHSITYSNLKSYYYMFGIRDGDTWLSFEGVSEISYLLDIPTVPVLYEGTFETEKELKEKVLELIKEPSRLGSPIMEGCVIRLRDSFTDEEFSNSIFKWVRKGHVKTDEHWTRNWKKAKLNNHEKL